MIQCPPGTLAIIYDHAVSHRPLVTDREAANWERAFARHLHNPGETRIIFKNSIVCFVKGILIHNMSDSVFSSVQL